MDDERAHRKETPARTSQHSQNICRLLGFRARPSLQVGASPSWGEDIARSTHLHLRPVCDAGAGGPSPRGRSISTVAHRSKINTEITPDVSGTLQELCKEEGHSSSKEGRCYLYCFAFGATGRPRLPEAVASSRSAFSPSVGTEPSMCLGGKPGS